MHIKKFSWKVEFQGRGAGHIHGTLWCDLNKIMKDENHQNSEEKNVNNSLESAFKKLRQNEELSSD